MSSYGEAHYMYAFVGEGVCKRGKKSVPFFGSKDRAIEWHEQWLLDRVDRKPRLKDVEYGVGEGGLAVRVAGLRLWHSAHRRGRSTGYQGVTEKLVKCDGASATVCVAKYDGEYLGTFATAVEAAAAFASHLARRGLTLPEGASQSATPEEFKASQQPPLALQPLPDHLAEPEPEAATAVGSVAAGGAAMGGAARGGAGAAVAGVTSAGGAAAVGATAPGGAAAVGASAAGGDAAVGGASKRRRVEAPKQERPLRPPAAHIEREEARQLEALRRRVCEGILASQAEDAGEGLLDTSLYSEPSTQAAAANLPGGASSTVLLSGVGGALAGEESVEYVPRETASFEGGDLQTTGEDEVVAAVAAESDAESEAESVD